MPPLVIPQQALMTNSLPESLCDSKKQRYRRLLSAEDGSTAVEYAIMVGLVCSILLTSVRALGNASMATFSQLSRSLESAPEYAPMQSQVAAPVAISVPARK
jgi:Flp pilus assembly pilin Flp